jgi:hypothetical protein
MNLEEIKTEWLQYNQRLQNSQRLNEKIILSMLKERSKSRVSKIRRQHGIYMVLMVICFLFLAAILAGNPFDFKYKWQYIPYGFLAIGVLLAIVSLIKSIRSFSININNVSLDVSLKKIIGAYEKNKKIERLFGILIITAGTLTAFSFLPNKLEHKALWPALVETAISIIITLSIYFIAFKSGAFKNRNKEDFENDLKEWNELKNITSELNE